MNNFRGLATGFRGDCLRAIKLIVQFQQFVSMASICLIAFGSGDVLGAPSQALVPLSISMGENLGGAQQQQADDTCPKIKSTPPASGIEGVPSGERRFPF